MHFQFSAALVEFWRSSSTGHCEELPKQRRGNPFPFCTAGSGFCSTHGSVLHFRKCGGTLQPSAERDGLPHQCAHWFAMTRWKLATALQEPLCPLRGISPVRGDNDDCPPKAPLKGEVAKSPILPEGYSIVRRTPLPPIHGRFHSAPWAEFHMPMAYFTRRRRISLSPPHPVPVPSHNPSTARTKGEIPC